MFDATNLGATLGGTPLTILTLFGDTPRALAVTPDGSTVYAAVFHSGNRTTTVSEGAVCDTDSTNLNNNTVQGACTIERRRRCRAACRCRTATSPATCGPRSA